MSLLFAMWPITKSRRSVVNDWPTKSIFLISKSASLTILFNVVLVKKWMPASRAKLRSRSSRRNISVS